MRGGAPRERGRPARMHSRCVPLSFPAMQHPATLPTGTAWARPKQSPGVFAGRAGWRKWARPCLKQNWEPAGFSWIYPVDSQDVTLSLRPAGSAPLSGQSRIPFLLTWMDRMYRIFSGDGWFEVLDFRKSAAITAGVSSGAAPSHPDYPVHPVHPCSKILFPTGHERLLFHSRMIRTVVRGGGGACLKQNWEPARFSWIYLVDSQDVTLSLRPAGSAPLSGRSRIPFFIDMDAQDAQDFFRRRLV